MSPATRPRAGTDLRGLVQGIAWTIAGTVLLQAALAGRFLFAGNDLVTVHRIVAEALAPIALALVWAGFATRPVQAGLRLGSLAVLGLVIMQTALGFAGRDNTDVASLHVPFGVALFGVAIIVAMIARRPRPSG